MHGLTCIIYKFEDTVTISRLKDLCLRKSFNIVDAPLGKKKNQKLERNKIYNLWYKHNKIPRKNLMYKIVRNIQKYTKWEGYNERYKNM